MSNRKMSLNQQMTKKWVAWFLSNTFLGVDIHHILQILLGKEFNLSDNQETMHLVMLFIRLRSMFPKRSIQRVNQQKTEPLNPMGLTKNLIEYINKCIKGGIDGASIVTQY